ncbi:glycosidase [Vibrio ishigakensis]|uniref:Glycosidase n=1 Tax=Vibrio ishigakensis TaxID=1481914 RepID=A0A0B8QTA9_9VIBR|nr:glycosidase [Vibrio ishigakensis]
MTGDTLTANQADLRSYVSKLMEIRDANPALYAGERRNLEAQGDIYIDLKSSGDNKIVYTANLGPNAQNITLSSEQLGTNEDLIDLMTNEVVEVKSGNYQSPCNRLRLAS